jgi:hypothetical protein
LGAYYDLEEEKNAKNLIEENFNKFFKGIGEPKQRNF